MVVKHSSKPKHAAPKKTPAPKPAKKSDRKRRIIDGKVRKKNIEASEQVLEEPFRKKSDRPEDVVTYTEQEYELRELPAQGTKVLIGPLWLTRFERARITGARSLQLSLGAPSLIRIPERVSDSISLAIAELDMKALPISIRRILPNGFYQDIPIDWLK